MRKIISILVALGMVLAISTMAVPVGAQPCATVGLGSACAGASTTYTINFTAPVTLQPVNDKLSFEFGAGTTFGTFTAGDIKVNTFNVDVATAVVSGTRLEFEVPAAAGVIVAGSAVSVEIAGVVNPGVAGTYTLTLDYELSCCGPVDFCTVDYDIIPAVSTYGFHWDSSMTYNGIALDFVPPFKVCGQDNFPYLEPVAGKYANLVNFILTPTIIGCAGPCASPVELWLTVNGAGGNCTMVFNGTTLYPVLGTPIDLGDITLGFNTTFNWSAAIHFDTVGDFQICLEAICPAGAPVCPACISEEVTVAEECWDISVYQHKDAVKIPLFRKWNLISLPLVPLEDPNYIEDVIAAHPAPAMLEAFYYYDRCADAWSVWGNGQTSLATLEDGKSYWLKVEYDHADPLKQPGDPVAGLWVWGTPQPVPPASPAAYPVCDGWNMVGLTGYDDGTFLTDIDEANYFWNLTYGQVYAWDGALQQWHSVLGLFIADLQVGEGYWISVAGNGMIYPP